jgi:hypothetical protein
MHRTVKIFRRGAALAAPVMPRVRDGLVLRPVALVKPARGKGLLHAHRSR